MRKLFLAFLAVAFLLPLSWAQEYRGNLFLTVLDDAGQPAPGATIALTGADFTRTATADADGKARFIKLEPGLYDLRVTLQGFQPTTKNKLEINTGASVEYLVRMFKMEITEEVTVQAVTPVMDRRKTGTATVVSTGELTKIPQVRDPWSVLSTIPGIVTDRVNVGGSQAGQQSNFAGKGDNGYNTSWVMDGVDFTDVGATGSTATYLDFNSFAEIGVATSGVDFEQTTPGLRLAFVTKQGANRLTGTMRMLYADEDYQSNNKPDNLPEGFGGNRINETFEKNFDIGGPIVNDRAWWWFGFTKNDIAFVTIDGNVDRTALKNISLKLHGNFNEAKTNWKAFYSEGDKIKNGRTFTLSAPEAAWDQEGPTPLWTVDVSHFFSSNFEVSAQYNHVDGKFSLTPRGSGQMVYDDDFILQNTSYIYDTTRPVDQFIVRGNAFLQTGDWEHELKFGYKYKEATVESLSQYGSEGVLAYKPYGFFYLARELNTETTAKYQTLWVGDTVVKGPWTLLAGLSYNIQSGKQKSTSVAGPPFCPECIPGGTFNGFDPGFEWNDILPRLGASYTFDMDHRLILRASYARYADVLGGDVLSSIIAAPYYKTTAFLPVGIAKLSFDWEDLNGNGLVDPYDPEAEENEWDPEAGYDPYNFDPENPSAFVTPNKYDKDLKSPRTDELILGAEYELAPDFTIGANLTYREKDRIIWTPLIGVSYDDYAFGGYAEETIRGRTFRTPYYYLENTGGTSEARPRIMTNRPGYTEVFKGLELTAIKRLSNKWQMRAFASWQDWERQFDGKKGIQDPTNLVGGTTTDGGILSYNATNSGPFKDVFVGSSKWQFNVNGMYQLPWDLMIGGNLYVRQGYIIPFFVKTEVEDYDGFVTKKDIQLGAPDEFRLPTLTTLDLRLAKLWKIKDTSVEVAVECFNVLNENTVLQRQRGIGSGVEDRITEILSPRIFRFGATISF